MRLNRESGERLADHLRTDRYQPPIRPDELPRETQPQSFVYQTPPGGIPARSGAVCGKASCALGELYVDGSDIKIRAVSPAVMHDIVNMVEAAIAGDEWIQVKLINGQRVIDVENCGGN